MPSVKMKTHKGVKKRFKVSANGKVSHKRCGSSHLNSHKSGKQIRRLRKKSVVKIGPEAQRLRRALRTHEVLTQHKPEAPKTGESVPRTGREIYHPLHPLSSFPTRGSRNSIPALFERE